MQIDTSIYTEDYIAVLREVEIASRSTVLTWNIDRKYCKENALLLALGEHSDLYIKRVSGPTYNGRITIIYGSALDVEGMRFFMDLEIVHEGKTYVLDCFDGEVETEHYPYEESATNHGVLEICFNPKEIVK